MKKVSLVFTAMLFVLFAFSAKAQSKPGADYFTGTWNILLKGTPNGDVKMAFKFDRMSDSLSGTVLDSTGAELSKMSKIELKDNEVTVYFTAQGFDVNVVMTKKDDDHIAGSLMGMFDVDGERKK